MTATRQPRQHETGKAMAAMRRTTRAIRDLHSELVLGTEAILRPVGLPRPRPSAAAHASAAVSRQAQPTDRVNHAA